MMSLVLPNFVLSFPTLCLGLDLGLNCVSSGECSYILFIHSVLLKIIRAVHIHSRENVLGYTVSLFIKGVSYHLFFLLLL